MRARYLNAEGTAKERTFVTGSPMAEVLHANLAKIEASDVLERLGLEAQKYMLLSAHREENIGHREELRRPVHLDQPPGQKPTICRSSTPATRAARKRLEAMGFALDPRVRLHEPLGFHDYNHLQMNAFCVVSDSGTLPEESSFFLSVGHPFPAVCIRTSTERPEALDKACFVLAGISEGGVEQAVATAVAMRENGDDGIPGALLYRGCLQQGGQDHPELHRRCEQDGLAQAVKQTKGRFAWQTSGCWS